MVITISRDYGSAGLAVARDVAERLGFRLIHDQLPTVIAQQFGMSAENVEAIAETGPTIGERFLSALRVATPETASPGMQVPDLMDERVRRAVEDEIRRYGMEGNVVILGRIASRILGAGPGRLRVFLHAPFEWRVQHIMEALSVDERTARREIARIDESRRAYARENYGLVWGDAREYDLTLNVARLGTEGAVDMIVTASGSSR